MIEVTLIFTVLGFALLEFGTSEASFIVGTTILFFGGFAALSLIGGYGIYIIQNRERIDNWAGVIGRVGLGIILLVINLLTLALYLSDQTGSLAK